MRNVIGSGSLPPSLSDEEQIKYFKLYQSTGEKKYRDYLIEHNLRLITDVISSKFYLNDEEESFSTGCEALIKSVDKFDLSEGVKFSTFASKAIENAIRHEHAYNNRKKRSADIISLQDNPYKKYNIDDDRNLTYLEIIRDEKTSMTEMKELLYTINDFLKTISDRDKRMFELYYGLNGNDKLFEKEIAKIFNVTRQCVSDKNLRTLSKLKLYLIESGFDINVSTRIYSKK